MEDSTMKAMLSEYAAYALNGILSLIPDKEPRKYLYDLVADYPSRGGKGFRPGLCIAACRAHGGKLDQVLPTAISIELFHNAFLIHDDIEDESYMRRGKPTMHQYSNLGIAINLGDAMNVLSFSPLMLNQRLVGNQITFKVLQEVQHMVTESVEGQAIELGWRKDNSCRLTDADYLRMILKKTCWYTCIHPIRIGALIGTHGRVDVSKFDRLGMCMGTAFQIQDDILNLIGNEEKYGKEIAGDLVEGKRTLMLIHLLNHCTPEEHASLTAFLGTPHQSERESMAPWVLGLMHYYGSITYAREIAKYMAGGALKEFYSTFSGLPASSDKAFLERMIIYMINRDY
jgi:geranylgeranyl diphosphate synthase, type II